MQVQRWIIAVKLFLILVAVSLALKNTRERTEAEYAKIREYEIPHQTSPKFNKFDTHGRWHSRATEVTKVTEKVTIILTCTFSKIQLRFHLLLKFR